MGHPRAGGWGGADWVGPSGSAQSARIGFLFFSEFISSAKNNPKKSVNYF
jgi:hypothetical protein